MGLVIILAVIAVCIAAFAVAGFRIIQQAETMVIERLGVFHRILESGVNIIWPVIDKPREIAWKTVTDDGHGHRIYRVKKRSRIDLRETVYDFPSQHVITRDEINISIDAIIYFQVVDAQKAIYGPENLPDAIEKLTQATLRDEIGKLLLNESLNSRVDINRNLQVILDEATKKWGVKINRVELMNIEIPEAVKAAMETQMRAERDRQAAITTAEGIRDSEIFKAEGQRQSDILRADGIAQATVKTAQANAEAISLITRAIAQAGSDEVKYLITTKYIDALTEMGSGKETKTVFMPYETSGLISSLGGIRELFAK
ncbi:MAG: SPFH/Band 7/PHB domain protein [Bacteroidetes bacterium]|nr:SPFH/Band 7/PHB domain protein [Bacteroidota bacterium]